MTPAKKKDYYQVLGVGEKAAPDEMKKAYRKLAKQFHPDANGGDRKASNRFKEVGEAYSVLSNPAKRKQYDQMRRLGAFGLGGRPGSGRGPGPGARSTDPGFSFDDLQGGFGNISDLFSTLFDNMGKQEPSGGSKGGRQKGENVEYVVEIPFLTAVRGGKVTIDVSITEDCVTCSGDGAKPGTEVHACKECKGTGDISFGQGGFAVKRPCPACFGRGKIPTTPCVSCEGRGSVRQRRKLHIDVPVGVDTGAKRRLSGQGERGKAGGPAIRASRLTQWSMRSRGNSHFPVTRVQGMAPALTRS